MQLVALSLVPLFVAGCRQIGSKSTDHPGRAYDPVNDLFNESAQSGPHPFDTSPTYDGQLPGEQ